MEPDIDLSKNRINFTFGEKDIKVRIEIIRK